MSNVRRWYIYIVSVISLQAVAWAVIALLRNLLVFGIDPLAVAFQIAVVIIGLPVFLAHWLWGQRLGLETKDERGATLRRLYLYGTLAAFLGPFIANAFDFIRRFFGTFGDYQSVEYKQLSVGEAIIFHLAALIVLGVLWFYHQRVATEDARIVPEVEGPATIRRLYIFGFSAVGLTMISMAVINLIRWIMLQFGSNVIRSSGLSVELVDEIIRLVLGLLVWLIFWGWAQRIFEGPNEEERLSILRKFYLYAAIFIGALGVVANATGILAGIFRRLLDLAPEGDIRQPLPIVIGMGGVWAYHAFVLRNDAQNTEEGLRQAGVRRLYFYLIAAVGLAALLVGISGDISVTLRALDTSFGEGLREQLSWFTAAIIAGLPVWIIPWWQSQNLAGAAGPAGKDERSSGVRKMFLYFFLFVATMTVLSSAVYIVFRILSMVLGEAPPTFTELGNAISFSIISIAVWLYHGSVLRSDGELAKAEQASELESLRVVLIDVGDGQFGRALDENLKSEIPGIRLERIVLTPNADESEDKDSMQEGVENQLIEAGLIIGSWMITVAGGAQGAIHAEFAEAVLSSPARKLLVPFHSEGMDWAGVDRWESEALVHQTVRAVQQFLSGEEIKAHRPMGAFAIIGILIGVFILLNLLAIPLIFYFSS